MEFLGRWVGILLTSQSVTLPGILVISNVVSVALISIITVNARITHP